MFGAHFWAPTCLLESRDCWVKGSRTDERLQTLKLLGLWPHLVEANCTKSDSYISIQLNFLYDVYLCEQIV